MCTKPLGPTQHLVTSLTAEHCIEDVIFLNRQCGHIHLSLWITIIRTSTKSDMVSVITAMRGEEQKEYVEIIKFEAVAVSDTDNIWGYVIIIS